MGGSHSTKDIKYYKGINNSKDSKMQLTPRSLWPKVAPLLGLSQHIGSGASELLQAAHNIPGRR